MSRRTQAWIDETREALAGRTGEVTLYIPDSALAKLRVMLDRDHNLMSLTQAVYCLLSAGMELAEANPGICLAELHTQARVDETKKAPAVHVREDGVTVKVGDTIYDAADVDDALEFAISPCAPKTGISCEMVT